MVLALGKAGGIGTASPEQSHGLMFRPDAILHPERGKLPALGLPEGTKTAVGVFPS